MVALLIGCVVDVFVAKICVLVACGVLTALVPKDMMNEYFF